MESDIIHFVTRACPCRPNMTTLAPLTSVTTSSPFELVSIGLLHLEQSSGGYKYILVVTDHFTRFGQAYPTKNNSSTTAADRLYNDLCSTIWFPNQRREFENKPFQRLHKLGGVTVFVLHRTIVKGMKKWKDSIGFCCPCSGLSQRTRKKGGRTSLTKLCMFTVLREMT